MNINHINNGPSKKIINIGHNIISILVKMIETRLKLVVVELEEEKAKIIQIFIMIGLTIIFTAFGLMSLIILIIYEINPTYRLFALFITTAVLLILAMIFGIWTVYKARNSSIFRYTLKELNTDRKLLEKYRL